MCVSDCYSCVYLTATDRQRKKYLPQLSMFPLKKNVHFQSKDYVYYWLVIDALCIVAHLTLTMIYENE